MQGIKRIRIIIDTNLFISFLIGKQLRKLKNYLVNSRVVLILTKQSILEIKLVTARPKFKKYFSENDVEDLIDLIQAIGYIYEISDIPKICRDPKDDFLLGLAEKGKADYLITGDNDLLILNTYKKTKIITVAEFEQIWNN